MPIKRDAENIVIQHSRDDWSYADGGDSAMRTGILAWAGSHQDELNLGKFEIKPGLFVRHPTQAPWNNPNNFTRDQLVCYVAGCFAAGYSGICERAFITAVHRRLRAQNTEADVPGSTKHFPDGADLLMPDIMYFLGICAGLPKFVLAGLAIFGYPMLVLNILWSTLVKPYGEQNQLICICSIVGVRTLKFYRWLHPNYQKALVQYWGGWRDQMEIADKVINKIERLCGKKQ